MTYPNLWVAVTLCTTLTVPSAHAKLAVNGPQAGASPISHVAADGKRLGRAATRDTRVVADPPPPDLTTMRLPDGTGLRVER